jgi:exopolysaccharide biosynthesis protein
VLGRGYRPDVVQDRLVARVTPQGGAALEISNVSSPSVRPGGIGLYTSSWGLAPGRRVLDGATKVRQVVIHDGVVRYNGNRLSSGRKFTGTVLLGSDRGAYLLRTRLPVGTRVTIKKSLSVAAHVAVSGSLQLLHDGKTTTKDNRDLHPRTALGIDRDEGLLHLVVVDGRSENSGGQTLLQLAQLLQSLGDEEAVNLDGGGSSTMVAREPDGAVAVRNQPSDGHERPVPNGLGFRYTPPPG